MPSDVQTAEDFPNCECMFLSYGIANYVIYMHVSREQKSYQKRQRKVIRTKYQIGFL